MHLVLGPEQHPQIELLHGWRRVARDVERVLGVAFALVVERGPPRFAPLHDEALAYGRAEPPLAHDVPAPGQAVRAQLEMLFELRAAAVVVDVPLRLDHVPCLFDGKKADRTSARDEREVLLFRGGRWRREGEENERKPLHGLALPEPALP
jgi:hypothetical protein